jgi:hypothetical protein
VASPFGCRSGHISAFAEATLPRDGQVGEGVSLALDARTEGHNGARRSTYAAPAAMTDHVSVARMPRFSSSVTAGRRLAATDALEPHGINNSAPRCSTSLTA